MKKILVVIIALLMILGAIAFPLIYAYGAEAAAVGEAALGEAAVGEAAIGEAAIGEARAFPLIRNIIIAVIAGFLISFIKNGSRKAELKSVHKKDSASDYVKEGSFKLTDTRELFLYTTVDRKAIKK